MEIKRAGSQPSGKGPDGHFTGTVRVDPLFQAEGPARVAGAGGTFEPGARTAWHTHPLGQTFIMTAGLGRVQREGGPIEEIRPGDVICLAPSEKHWQGASPTTVMTHVAIQERQDGKAVHWMEKVTDSSTAGSAAEASSAFHQQRFRALGAVVGTSLHSTMTERKVMKKIIAMTISLALISATPALAEDMAISQNGSRATVQGPGANFTGSVLVEPLYGANTNIGSTGGHVTFAPGARSDWHTHPAGQVLIVTDGVGWVQEEGGAKREIKPGDIIWTPPGVKHWHGATTTNGMRHIAISGMLNGKNVDWMEKVTDEQYGAR